MDPLPPGLALNQIQFIATHNSSHQISHPDERLLLGAGVHNLLYTHASLTTQLSRQHVRGVELDLYPDPRGGRYAYPMARRLARHGRSPENAWNTPGFKVFHQVDTDYRSSVPLFRTALRQIRQWSVANPGHVPIVIQLETKIRSWWQPQALVGFARVPRWSPARLDDLDNEIRSVFPASALITPDRLRRPGRTLEQSVLAGWPPVDEVRGTVMFFFDYGSHTEIRDRYRAGRPNLEGRIVFTTPPPGEPDAAVMMVNDPHDPALTEMVRRGYFVRTRSDGGPSSALRNDHATVAAALASGAQMVSTDYPEPGMAFRFGDGLLCAQLPGGEAVRPNPITT